MCSIYNGRVVFVLIHVWDHASTCCALSQVYAGKAAWIDTEEGQFWKTTRDVGIDPKKLHLVTTVQVRVGTTWAVVCCACALVFIVNGTVEQEGCYSERLSRSMLPRFFSP